MAVPTKIIVFILTWPAEKISKITALPRNQKKMALAWTFAWPKTKGKPDRMLSKAPKLAADDKPRVKGVQSDFSAYSACTIRLTLRRHQLRPLSTFELSASSKRHPLIPAADLLHSSLERTGRQNHDRYRLSLKRRPKGPWGGGVKFCGDSFLDMPSLGPFLFENGGMSWIHELC